MARIEVQTTGSSNDIQYTVFPQGTYELQVSAIDLTNSAKGNQQLTVRCVIADGDYADKKITLWLSLLPQAAWRVEAFVKALGVDYEKGDDGLVSFETDDCIGVYFRANAKVREFNGKERNDWEQFAPSTLTDAAPAPVAAPQAAKAAPAPQAQPQPATVERRSRRLA